MKITINGTETEVKASNLQELSIELQLPDKGVAMAMNNRMVTRANWAETPLQEGAPITIIKAACGG